MDEESKLSLEIEDFAEDHPLIEEDTQLKPINATKNLNGSGVGLALAIFVAYSLRLVIAPWLWNGKGLSIFIPIISPVYRQAEHWQSDGKQIAICIHIISGAITLLVGILQFHHKLRSQYKAVHRWAGRIYVLCGFLTIASLRTLRASVGAGSTAHGHSDTLAGFVDVASIMWILATTLAVGAAMRKKFNLHRDAMALSLALAAVPIPQRFLSWCIVTPCALMLRLSVAIFTYEMPPWSARWGRPTSRYSSRYSLLFETSNNCDIIAELANLEIDSRACPLVFSLDGYGEAEQVAFPLSAWLALLWVICWGAPRLVRHVWPPSSSAALAASKADGELLSSCDQGDVIFTMAKYVNECAMEARNRVFSVVYPSYDESEMGLWLTWVVSVFAASIGFLVVGFCAFAVLIFTTHALLWGLLHLIGFPLYWAMVLWSGGNY